MAMLQPGESVPHFDVARTDGQLVRYASLWQRKNLVLVRLPEPMTGNAEEYAAQLTARLPEITGQDAECVITRDEVPGMPVPGALVADRWGEVHFVQAGLPPVAELIEWLQYLQVKCPECEGEAL